MGEAKRRGTYEDRKADAVARGENLPKPKVEVVAPNHKPSMATVIATAMTLANAGIPTSSNRKLII